MAQNKTPAASRRGFLRSGAVAALAGAVAAPVAVAAAETPAISPELERLIEAHRQAWDHHRFGDFESDDDCFAASAEDDAAIDALCAYCCRTIEEARAWSAHISCYLDHIDYAPAAVSALRALAGLPVEEEA